MYSVFPPTERELDWLHPPLRRDLRHSLDPLHPRRHTERPVVLQEAMPRVSLREACRVLGSCRRVSLPGHGCRPSAGLLATDAINFIAIFNRITSQWFPVHVPYDCVVQRDSR